MKNLNSYVLFLEKIMHLISVNMDVIKNSPSLDYKIYYVKNINNFNLVKKDENLEILNSSFECKKSISRALRLGQNILKDIIKYCNRYKIDESVFFEYLDPILKNAHKNYKVVSESFNNTALIDIKKLEENNLFYIKKLFNLHQEITKELNNFEIKEKRIFLLNNNIENNIRFLKRNFNKKNIYFY